MKAKNRKSVELFQSHIANISVNSKLMYDSLRQLSEKNVNEVFLECGDEFISNENSEIDFLHDAYKSFTETIKTSCQIYFDQLAKYEEERSRNRKEFTEMIIQLEEEMDKNNALLNNAKIEKNPSFVYRNNKKSSGLDVELVSWYNGSKIYREFQSGRRTKDGDVFIDNDGEYDELIVKYMNGNASLLGDIDALTQKQKSKFLDDLSTLELPVKVIYLEHLFYDEDKTIMNKWRTAKDVMVNQKTDKDLKTLLEQYQLFETVYENQLLKNIKYSKETQRFSIDMQLKYCDAIKDYLRNGKVIKDPQILAQLKKEDDYTPFINELKMLQIEPSKQDLAIIEEYFDYYAKFLPGTRIVKHEYDPILKEWLGTSMKHLMFFEYKWKLIFRASEHDYRARAFHECCDDKGPTLIIIKSTGGWIFGGYTTQSWKYDGM